MSQFVDAGVANSGLVAVGAEPGAKEGPLALGVVGEALGGGVSVGEGVGTGVASGAGRAARVRSIGRTVGAEDCLGAGMITSGGVGGGVGTGTGVRSELEVPEGTEYGLSGSTGPWTRGAGVWLGSGNR